MARDITLFEDEMAEMEKKLMSQKATLPKDEAELLEFLLKRAKTERAKAAGGPGWTFSWTYRF